MGSHKEPVSGDLIRRDARPHQIGGAWVACGAAIDALVTVNAEGNHKGCPYTDVLCARNVARADLDRSCRGSYKEPVSGVLIRRDARPHQIGGAWVACGAAIDALATVNAEGNHKGCPYTDVLCARNVPRADLDRSCRSSSCGCPYRESV